MVNSHFFFQGEIFVSEIELFNLCFSFINSAGKSGQCYRTVLLLVKNIKKKWLCSGIFDFINVAMIFITKVKPEKSLLRPNNIQY